MGLDALQRSALEQAHTAVQQAKATADARKADAQAIDKPVNAGSAPAKQAVTRAFAAADDAETAAEDAKKLAKQYDAGLTDSVREAKKAADRARNAQINAEVAYERAERELNKMTAALGPAEELARETAKRAGAAAVPASMTDRLDRLNREEAELTRKRDEAERAFQAAKAEITKAQEAFEKETKAADDTVRCKQGYLSLAWYGPTVTAKETQAQLALQKATSDLSVPDEEFQKLEKELQHAVALRKDYQEAVNAKKKLKLDADGVADRASDALKDLNRNIQAASGEFANLDSKLKGVNAMKEGKDKDFAALVKLQDLDKDADAALTAANEARQKGLAVCDSLGLVKERLDADIDSGAVFNNLTAEQARALKGFNREGSFGENARRLGPELNNLSEADFLVKMATETPHPPKTKLIGPMGAQQTMSKWEYADGTIVRYKPLGDAYSNGMATYSIEVKTSRAAVDQNLGNIGFKVDPQGRAVPKAPGDLKNPYAGVKGGDYRDQAMKLGHRSLP